MRARRTIIACIATLSVSSCAPRPVDVGGLAGAPQDFTLAVTVTSPARTLSEAERLPPGVRPASYLVEPDGALRVAVGPAASPTVFPPLARQLTREQVDRLWVLARDAGVLDPDHPGRVQNVETFRTTHEDTMILVYAGFLGVQRHTVVRLRAESLDDGSLAPLIDELNTLAWMRDWYGAGTP